MKNTCLGLQQRSIISIGKTTGVITLNANAHICSAVESTLNSSIVSYRIVWS